MSKKTYPPEFKKEAASLVLDQDYTRKAACEAMGVGATALERWVRQLRDEREGITPERSTAITETQREIQGLKAQVRRLEREKEILKKATALLMSDTLNK
jgi:transposase